MNVLIQNAIVFLKSTSVLIVLALVVEFALRLRPSKRPHSIPHVVGHAIMRIGYYLDKVLPQRLK